MASSARLELEQRVLGCALLDRKVAAQLRSQVAVDAFARPFHRDAFTTIVEVLEAGADPTPDLVAARMPGDTVKNRLELSTIQNAPAALVNHAEYATDLLECADREALEESLATIVERVNAGEAPTILLEKDLEDAIAASRERRAGRSGESYRLQDLFDRWDDQVDNDRIPFPIPTLTNIDGGQTRGQIVVVGGYSADGKSFFAGQQLMDAARRGARCLFVSIEMPMEEDLKRLFGTTGIPMRTMTKADLYAPDVLEQTNEILQLPIDIMDASTGVTSAEKIRMAIQRASLSGDPYRYVVVDHVHLMQVEGSGDYRLELNNAMGLFKRTAVEYGCTIMLVAQLKRAQARGDDAFRMPNMTDFRESSGIENIADYALMVWREREHGVVTDTGRIVVAKVRSGTPPQPIPVRWLARRLKFVEMQPEVPGAFV